MAVVENAELVITTLTIAAGLALGVERSLELLKHFINSANGQLGEKERKTLLDDAADKIRQAEDKINIPSQAAMVGATIGQSPRQQELVQTQGSQQVSQYAADSEASEKHLPPPIPIIPQTPLSPVATAKALFFQMAAAGMGIILAWWFDIRLLDLLTSVNGTNFVDAEKAPLHAMLFGIMDLVFTGLVIGGGSQPIHLIIRFLTERKVSAPAEADKGEQSRALGEVISTAGLIEEKKEESPMAWNDITYQGGVRPETLEKTHKRPGDPNLIVYHHTAMSSSQGFQDIVNEFLIKKKWLTGYHCVIMPDGSINPFCRWDRYGNHARGINARSLGISFHGNFHTEPNDKYSNADGRYGNQKPTEAQMHAGARVVALWVALYEDIELDFDKSILPHYKAMPNHTVCPGSNFKHDEFRSLIRKYYDVWSSSETAQDKIRNFKKLPYLYA